MLPHKMPDSRITTYDWNANYKQGASQDRLLGHADKLLDLLDINRESTVSSYTHPTHRGERNLRMLTTKLRADLTGP